MFRLDYVVAVFAATVTLWLGLSVSVLVNRVLHDRRGRRFGLSTMSRRGVCQAIADPTLPAWQHERCIAYALDRWGLDRIRDDAKPGRPKWRRVAALLALAQLRSEDVYALLDRALSDRDADVGSTAIVALSRIGDRRAARILIGALVRESAPPSRIATQLDQLSIPIDDLLRPLLRSPQAHARQWAVSLLRRYPDTADLSGDIAALIDDSDAPVRKAVVETLVELNSPLALSAAATLIADPVAYVRSRAVRGFGAPPRGDLDDCARMDRARAIAPMLADTDWTVRLAAKEALVSLGPVVWREVAPVLQSPDRFARNGAAEVLQNVGLVDKLLEEAANGRTNGVGSAEMLELALREGGSGMIDAAAARSGNTSSNAVGRLLTRFGYTPAVPQ